MAVSVVVVVLLHRESWRLRFVIVHCYILCSRMNGERYHNIRIQKQTKDKCWAVRQLRRGKGVNRNRGNRRRRPLPIFSLAMGKEIHCSAHKSKLMVEGVVYRQQQQISVRKLTWLFCCCQQQLSTFGSNSPDSTVKTTTAKVCRREGEGALLGDSILSLSCARWS